MRIKHVMAGVTVAAGALLLSACDWDEFNGEQFSDAETLSQPVSEVRFSNDSGDVKITVGDTFEVRRTVGYRDTKPGKTYRMDGGALVLENVPGTQLLGGLRRHRPRGHEGQRAARLG